VISLSTLLILEGYAAAVALRSDVAARAI